MMFEQYSIEIVLLLILCKLSPNMAVSMADSNSDCNGHGRLLYNTSSGECVCESPYTGEECQLCSNGYYGDPSNGYPCYLSCSQHKLLSNFTYAGVGIDRDWLSRQEHTHNTYCLWFIAPDVSARLSQNESVIFNEIFNRIRNHQTANHNISSSHFNISLYFSTTDARFSASENSNCFNETVLIYDGIPNHLISLDRLETDISITSSSTTHECSYSNISNFESTSMGRLVRVFTGSELRNSHVTIQAPVLTVVYYYNGFSADSANARSTVTDTPIGFNLTASVDEKPLSQSQVDNSTINFSERCECYTVPCNCSQGLLHYSPIIPSLTTTTTLLEHLTDQNSSTWSLSTLERFHHSAVYDACTDLLWLYGGVDLQGKVSNILVVVNLTLAVSSAACDGGRCDSVEGEGVVGVINVDQDGGDGPMGRYSHSAVLVPCSEEFNSSRILVFGGFTARHNPSSELWLFDTASYEWTHLSSAPIALASHTAVLVGGAEMMVVIGGVREGLAISSRVMVYRLRGDQWEVWETNTLDMPGVYGHTSVYDVVTHSVLVFGGYLYSRPNAALSSSLYSLHLLTRRWTKVALSGEVPSRFFHSMVMSGDLLLVYGGLVGERQHTVGLTGVCTSDDVTLIDLRNECNKKIAITIQGDSIITSPPKLWGHKSNVRTNGQIILSGGTNTHASDTIALLSAPIQLQCQLANTQTDCTNIPDCQACISSNNTDFIGCYNTSNPLSLSACNSSNGMFVPNANSACDLQFSCSRFKTCGECLSVDLAISMGCLWCECNERCVDTQQDCACGGGARSVSNSSTPDVCYLEVCKLPSCKECTNHSHCQWLSIEIQRQPTRVNVIIVSQNPIKWGCYDQGIFDIIVENLPQHANNSLEVCPLSCNQHTSCSTCVVAYSPSGGQLMCVWSSYQRECMTVDTIPLLCAEGQCGAIVSTVEQCPQPCSELTTCDTCLQDSQCLWLYDPLSHDISCVGVTEELDLNETFEIFYFECPICSSNCSIQGVCLPNLTCACDVGYIGSDCSVECLCNGHSYCANDTEAGRRDCLQCLHNTQGVACRECLPLTVGSPIDGGLCVPCSEFCHGNSEVCLTENEYLTLTHRNVSLTPSHVQEYVMNGPNEEEGLCVDCKGFSRGVRCSSCVDGYYDSNVGGKDVVCIQCACNGHDIDGCDRHTGICTCQNNTFSQMCNDRPCNVRQQCNHCVTGYVGQPLDNGQCYKKLAIDVVSNFSLLANHTISLALGPNYLYSDVDVHVTFVVVEGTLVVYSTTDSDAVKVVTKTNTGTHDVQFDASSTLRFSRESPRFYRRNTDSVLRNIFRDDFFHHVVDSFSGDVSGSFNHEIIRKQVSQSVLSSDANGDIQQVIVGERQTLLIPHTDNNFLSSTHYFTILARGNAMFFVYFEQNAPRLNLYVFFGVFFSSFMLFSTIIISIWRFIHFVSEWRRRRRARRRQQRRRHRPFSKVYIYFGDSTIYKVCKHSEPKFNKKHNNDSSKGTHKTLHVAKSGTKNSREDSCCGPISTRQDFRRKNQSERQDVIELELKSTNTSTVTANAQSFPRTQLVTQKKQQLFGEEVHKRPVCIQPTKDELACVTTYIVRQPSRKYPICVGSALVEYQTGANTGGTKKKKRRMNFKKNNRCVPEVSSSQV